MALFGTEGASGCGTLAEFRFEAIGPGSCGFAFSDAVINDPYAIRLPSEFSVIPVQIEP